MQYASNGDRGNYTDRTILEKLRTFLDTTASGESVNYKAAHIMCGKANVGAMHVKRIGTDVNNDIVLFTLTARRNGAIVPDLIAVHASRMT